MQSFAQPTTAKRPYQGLEWVLLRLIPVLAVLGIVVPAALGWVLHWAWGADAAMAQTLRMADFWIVGFMVVFWSLLMTVTVGCVFAWVVRRKRVFGPGR